MPHTEFSDRLPRLLLETLATSSPLPLQLSLIHLSLHQALPLLLLSSRRFQLSFATEQRLQISFQMIDDQDLGFFANFLGIFIFIMVIAYHYVMADPKYEGN
ncbi:hypothetical protein AAC387_Pa07g3717 [Persea americana]